MSLEKSFSIGKLSTNSDVHMKVQILLLATDSSGVFLEMTGSLCSYAGKRLPDPQAWITTVHLSVALSSKPGDPWKKAGSSTHNWNHCTSTFLWDSRHSFICSRSEKAIRNPFLFHLWKASFFIYFNQSTITAEWTQKQREESKCVYFLFHHSK